MDSLNLMKESLEKRNPVLFLGAGFSYDSKNGKGEKVELASGLCELLFTRFFSDENTSKEEKAVASKFKDDYDLKRLCEYIRALNKVEERNQFFVDYFSGCRIENKDKRNYICDYPFKKIFTVNVDDLVENIFSTNKKQLNIWNLDNDITKHFNKYPTLIKLHGCVRNPNAGFVFDEEEYSEFQARDDRLINEFGDSSIKNDVIFLGTEFQEDDLKYIINIFSNKGYDFQNQYFFVTPRINDPITQLKIQNTANFHHISMSSDKFFDFLNNKLVLNDKLYNQLVELGLKDVSVLYSKIPTDYESHLYYGDEIKYADLKYNWDISENQKEIIDWIKEDDESKLVAFYGKEYVGKTCRAKRLLYSFFAIGYDCYEFSLSSTERIQLFVDYINNSSIDKDVAVLFENAAYSYELLINNIIEAKKYKHKIIIITTDLLSNHLRKSYSINANQNCKALKVEETINHNRAELIYDKLNEKKSLSRLLDISSKKSNIVDFMIQNNDIIDVLYYSSLGRSFEEYLKTYIVSQNIFHNKYVSILLLYNDLGITRISEFYFCKSASVLYRDFNYRIFKQSTKGILQIDNNIIHLRYSRFLHNHFSRQLTSNEVIKVIITLIKSISGRFNEGEYNEISELFYKAINLKALLIHLNKAKIKKLYYSLEKYCEPYSYYWVQRGICAQWQDEPEFENADRFLRLAREIRPYSYQVHHALAKNMIERGLCDIKKSAEDPNNYFDSGIGEMQELLYNPNYNRAFDYSLHAYISSWLKYCEYTHTTLNKDVCMLINETIGNLHSTIVDKSLLRLFLELKRYAQRNHLIKSLNAVFSKHWESNDDTIDYEEGYTDIY